MGQSNFNWAIVYGDGCTQVLQSTLEDLTNLIDWGREDIVAIIRLGFV